MNILTVNVTESQIGNAARLNMANPLTKAIGRATGRLGCYVIAGTVYDAGVKLFKLTADMSDWLARWLKGETVTPATFTVEVDGGTIESDESHLLNDGED